MRACWICPTQHRSSDGTRHFFPALARYTAAGKLDTRFGKQGKVTMRLGSDSSLAALAVQADGKLVAAGQLVIKAHGVFGHEVFALDRYLP